MANQNNKVTAAQAARDTIIASMRYGQLPFLAVFLVVVLIIWRMPSADLSRLTFEIVASLKQGELLGYVLFLISILSWFIHARWQRRKCAKEMDRIASEKSKLQSGALGNKIESSRSKARKKR